MYHEWSDNFLIRIGLLLKTQVLFDYPSVLIVPPRTEVVLKLAQASGSNKDMQTTVIGRIYRDA